MFGYRFTDHEATSNRKKMDFDVSNTHRKSKRLHFVKSYNKLSILRFVFISFVEEDIVMN